MSKFEVGDRVMRNGNNPDSTYRFMGIHKGNARKGDIFIISAASGDVYSVEGGYIWKTANWANMENHFDLINSWKQRYGGEK